MENLLIITPVKDSIVVASEAITRVCQSKKNYRYRVYNDRSLPESRTVLEHGSILGYELINIEDFTDSPSPNYRFTLIDAQQIALQSGSHLLIVESDVYVKPDTIEQLLHHAKTIDNCGIVAALTTDENGIINFPYLHIKQAQQGLKKTRHRISFCCTLLTYDLLKSFDFNSLSPKKHWFDVQISKKSRTLGFQNLIDTNLTVTHLPHSSRPWKSLKYKNPLKYYLRKYLKKLDRI
ncbi:MAG: glycosyltransferase family 2 protein [Bacteroidales bacterium]|nr:glycosyltransferase family 2 protein [Bacteroidales bacterium]